MDQNSIILYSIIVVVLIGVPVLISKKFGMKPMELLFGKMANRGLFKSKKDDSQQSDKPKERKQTNSNRNDMLDLISRLATYARRNHFRLIIPGTLSCNGEMAVLTALIITRCGVVGINCFGFGGRVVAEGGGKDWVQIMNGTQTAFPNPVTKNRNQEALVRRVLEAVGYPTAEVEVIGVFTSPSVWLSNTAGTNCYTKEEAMKVLRGDAYLRDGGLDPRALEAVLQPRIIRASSREETDSTAVEKGGKT
jgi:hypothetical protein